MVREEHEIAVDPVHLLRVRLLSLQTPEQIGGVAEVIARLHGVLALSAALGRADDGGEDRGEGDGLVERRLGQGVGRALRRNHRPQDVHRIGRRLHCGQRFAR